MSTGSRPTVEELEDALAIPFPVSDSLYLEDSRRLTGPGLLWDKPCLLYTSDAADDL